MKRQGQQKRSEDECRQRSREPDHANAANANPLGLEDLPSSPPPLKPWLGLFAFVLLSMAMFATAIVYTAAKDRKAAVLQAEENRLQESVAGRVKVLETWLAGQRTAGKRLTESRVFRLFVTDLSLQGSASPLPRSLQDQRPYFLQLMADFVRQNDLSRATVLKKDGTVLLSSPGPSLIIDDLLRNLEEAESGWTFLPSNIRRIDDRNGPFVIDLIMAFPSMQAENDGTGDPTTVLVLTAPIDPVLQSALSNEVASADLETISLLQQRGDVIDRFSMTDARIERSLAPSSSGSRAGASIDFGLQGDDRPVYASGRPVMGTAWTLLHAIDAKAALSPVHDFIKAASGLSAITVIALTATFSAFWWRQGRNHHRLAAEIHRTHAEKIDRQRQFLRSVTTSISDWLTVSSPDGKLIYANPAFQTAAGLIDRPITDTTWDDLVNDVSADQQYRDHLIHILESDPFDLVEVGGSRRVVSSHVSNLVAEDGDSRGTVRLVRDHTELVDERRRRLSSVSQTIDAFIHAIELRDPFLLGHTERVRTYAIAIGRHLGLTSDDLASLALAASLSQIGKIFIPDYILTKPERHSTEEMEMMRHHSLHAVGILERVNFDLPIVDIVAQMHERLDGSGYPHGLAGDQIGLSARILGVADIFSARTAPRSYRDRISAGKALYHLASNDGRYDLKVVAALAEIVGHGPAIDDLGAAEPMFIDAAVWSKRHREDDLIGEPA